MIALVPLALAVLITAGCGAGVDLAKSASPRKTVPLNQAGSGDSGVSGPVEEAALAPDKLRVVDPCQLINKDTLAEFGEPAESDPVGFDGCSNYMKDTQGKDLNITLRLGYGVSSSLIDQASASVEGLPAIEERQGGDTCFFTAVTSSEPPMGAQVYVRGKQSCQVGRQLARAVITQLRSSPPLYPQPPGNLVSQDPCAGLNDDAAAGVVGDGASHSMVGLHSCQWQANAATLDVTYKSTLAPGPSEGETDPPQQVDLNGVQAYQKPSVDADFASCELSWAHKKSPDKFGDSEVVTLQYNKSEPAKGEDPCGKLHGAAKALIGALPKP